ncbi:MAG: acyl-CoA dehydrogenase family protein, partial [Rhodobacteraceae bacterium]|nr:acyl-CoA dehydrogenase family protein [Paracoccaceae bacterium]
MPHDGQDMTAPAALLDNLAARVATLAAPLDSLLATATDRVRALVSEGGAVKGALIDRHQRAAHGLAWLATYVEAIRQMGAWASRLSEARTFGEIEALILQIGVGEYLWQIQGGIPMNQGEILKLTDMGLAPQDIGAFMSAPEVMTLATAGNSAAARARLVALMRENHGRATFGASGLDDELEMIRDQFRRFADEKVAPFAHEWHLKDEFIPMEIIEELAEMGVFGLTIPENLGGFGLSKASMVVVSEELSRGYIGVGSLGTRSEIAAELILAGGTDEQKSEWLPKIASAEIL